MAWHRGYAHRVADSCLHTPRVAVSLNRTPGDVMPVTETSKPFDVGAERPSIQFSRGDKTAIELFLVGVLGWEARLRHFPLIAACRNVLDAKDLPYDTT